MQALTTTNNGLPFITNKEPQQPMIILPENKKWIIAEKIGGKISIDLANGSSCNNSGRGSRSSGMQVFFNNYFLNFLLI